MKSFLIVIISCLAFSFQATAQQTGRLVVPQKRPVRIESEYRPHLGILAGAAQPEGRGEAASEIGFDVGYQPYIPYGAGLEYIHSRVDDGTDKKDRDTVWLKGSFNFGGTMALIRDSYVGLGLGVVMLSDRTAFAAAPLAGFDIPLEREKPQFVSLGAAARYAVVSDGEVDTFSLNGVVKYWF